MPLDATSDPWCQQVEARLAALEAETGVEAPATQEPAGENEPAPDAPSNLGSDVS